MRAPFLTTEILRDAPRQSFQAGDRVILCGQPTDRAYLVSKGSLINVSTRQVWKAGEVVSLTGFLALEEYIHDIEAVADTTTVLIQRSLFRMASDRENRMTWPLSVCLASAATAVIAS
ncbi:MAG: hypothetical protein CNE91_02160 [SAR116 cluster bacterium MED-G04]|jgi:CRP-like cAMP-binding protein|nr:hypothetical protein [SAR116 cluster bacterium]OUW37118.1 MAG: hypothetical protein CBD43_02345 [Gammaproteobacteria bacterium TMED183]PDH65850.1 MAG: hypothetical protein CNE91_02160 [SAR116 cluster bacterium MED-G04]HAO56976.1 hypothetical protein [Alphaproteobacteria bacterium]CAI8452956.1 MAG: Uncharacterised protein [SAR116 cluster bacterium MED-G04]|tara:strand:+ start:11454 stop:11807 length:354 start_codon:yes stop_codon:yes gene_type:complete